jgi:hypothetical protein
VRLRPAPSGLPVPTGPPGRPIMPVIGTAAAGVVVERMVEGVAGRLAAADLDGPDRIATAANTIGELILSISVCTEAENSVCLRNNGCPDRCGCWRRNITNAQVRGQSL